MVGGIGESLDNDAVARVGAVSRVLLPTDGLWRGAMHAFQDPALSALEASFDGHPFLGAAALTVPYLLWAAVWVAAVLGLAGAVFARRDL